VLAIALAAALEAALRHEEAETTRAVCPVFLAFVMWSWSSDSRPSASASSAPEVGQVYWGKVSGIMDFGCFVQLEGVKGMHVVRASVWIYFED
jgi:polyribonucleotide nucleotidyltransferase